MTWRLGLITAGTPREWHRSRLLRALRTIGEVELVEPSRLRLLAGRAHGRDRVQLLADEQDASRFDAVVLGWVAGPNAHADIQLDAARAFELIGVPCFSRAGPMLAAQDKLWSAAVLSRAGVPTPLCSSVPRRADVLVASTELGCAVAKPLFGSLGDGLFICNDAESRRLLGRVVREEAYLLQRFVPPGGMDYRLMVVGDRVEGALRREAAEGEWRSNMARGARAIAHVARREWRDVAVEATRALGLEWAGVDMCESDEGPMVLEVNAFPHFRPFEEVLGVDIAALLAQRIARVLRGQHRRGRPKSATKVAATEGPRRARA